MKKYLSFLIPLLIIVTAPAFAVLPTIFATQPAGNVAASLLDTNFTFLESQGVQGLTTTGSANAYIATPADAWTTGYSSYVARAITVIPNFTNTGTSTINVSGLGSASLYKNVAGVATALVSGDIKINVPAILICDGTGFLLANPTLVAANAVQFTSSAPTGTTSGTGVMLGLAGSITPTATGKILVTLSGIMVNTSTGGDFAQIYYGTGTAPVNGVAVTGTAAGQSATYAPSIAGTDVPYSTSAIITGLTVGTTYWLDVDFGRAGGAGTASLSNVNLTAQEIK